ncbi:MAG: M23 family metallopeptidase [Acidobacteriota bacterium]
MKRSLFLLSTLFFLTAAASAQVNPSATVWPISASATADEVDKPFGFRVLCGACTDPDDADFHRGIDIREPRGTNVHTVWNGTVVRLRQNANELRRWGDFVVIALDPITRPDGQILTDHKIAYLHLDSVESNLSEGTRVTTGQKVGEVGDSGQGINTVHLHFDYYQGSSDRWIRRAEARSPLEILPFTSQVPTVQLTTPSTDILRLVVEQEPESLDIVRFRIDHNGWSRVHGTDPIILDFNEKIGINMTAPDFEDENPFEGTTYLPRYFNHNSSHYELRIELDGDWQNADTFTVTLTNARDVDYVYNIFF